MAWSYSPSSLATNTTSQARFLIGDTNTNDQQLQDEEINFTLTLRGSIWGAAAMCCESIAANASRKADTTTGELRTLYSSIAKSYHARSAYYESQAAARGGALPIVGGISVMEKAAQEANPDRVPPNFNTGMTDNLNQPIGPAGNETSVPNQNNGINNY